MKLIGELEIGWGGVRGKIDRQDDEEEGVKTMLCNTWASRRQASSRHHLCRLFVV